MALDPTLRLLYDFKGQHNLNSKYGLGPTLTHTRTQDGYSTYFESTGILRYAAPDEPRFDHDPVTGEPLGLLVEEARENVLLQSSDFSTTWTTDSDASIETDVAISPDGNKTADRLIDDGSGGASNIFVGQNKVISAATAYTVSCFFKADQLDWALLSVDNMGALVTQAYFDLTNGAIGNTGANNTSEFIQDIGNGWYRCGIVFTSDAADTNVNVRVYLANGNADTTVARDGTSSVLMWGADLQAGTFPTSHIPTIATAQDRGADVIGTTDLSWLNNAAGTLYVEGSYVGFTPDGPTGYPRAVELTATNSYIALHSNAAADSVFTVQDTSVGQATITLVTALSVDTVFRVTGAWETDDFMFYSDGTAGTPDALGTIPAITSLNVGSTGVSRFMNGHIRGFRYYAERKSNSVLEALSNGQVGYGFPDTVVSSKASASGKNAAAIPSGTFIAGM